jgi:hypothetical protein
MKTFTKIDYYIQLLAVVVGFLSLINRFQDMGGLRFYFIVGGSQLISFLIRLFLKEKKSPVYIAYGILILPIWIILLFFFLYGNTIHYPGFLVYILIFSLMYSPVMAFIYIYYCYKTYQSYIPES